MAFYPKLPNHMGTPKHFRVLNSWEHPTVGTGKKSNSVRAKVKAGDQRLALSDPSRDPSNEDFLL